MNGRTNAVAGTTLPVLSNPAGAGQILNGYQAIGADGSIITGTIPSRGAQTVTPGRSNQTIAAGQYLSGTQTIAGDTDLTAGNIRSGVNIFGVSGSYEGAEVVTEKISSSATSGNRIILDVSEPIKELCGLNFIGYTSNNLCCFAYPGKTNGELYGIYNNPILSMTAEANVPFSFSQDKITLDFSSVQLKFDRPTMQDAWVCYIPT